MRVQAGRVPGAEDFSHFILSNSRSADGAGDAGGGALVGTPRLWLWCGFPPSSPSLAVASLLRHYLTALDLSSDIVFGRDLLLPGFCKNHTRQCDIVCDNLLTPHSQFTSSPKVGISSKLSQITGRMPQEENTIYFNQIVCSFFHLFVFLCAYF